MRKYFENFVPKEFTTSHIHVLCANFVKFSRPEIGKVVRYLPDKKSARSLALASARIAPKICQGQLQTIYSEFPKFHPNPFTSGGVIAERVNIVQTRHKVFAILGEASASSPSNEIENRNQILEMCKFWVWFRLVHYNYVRNSLRISPNLTRKSEM